MPSLISAGYRRRQGACSKGASGRRPLEDVEGMSQNTIGTPIHQRVLK